MIIFINGFTASGKTTIGKDLAEQLNLPFIDLDRQIESKYATSISEIFKTEGEAGFRSKENSLLKELIRKTKWGVIALGGGTACSEENLQLVLRSGIAVYLNRPLTEYSEEMWQQLLNRPLFSALPRAEAEKNIQSLWEQRQRFYGRSQLETLVNAGFSPKKLANTLKLLTNRPQSL